MEPKSNKILRIDAKRRVTLGKLIEKDVVGFCAHIDNKGRIILEPLIEKLKYEVKNE